MADIFKFKFEKKKQKQWSDTLTVDIDKIIFDSNGYQKPVLNLQSERVVGT